MSKYENSVLSENEIELLCTRYFYLVQSCAEKYRRLFPEDQMEEIKSDGGIGLLEALTTFNPDKSGDIKKYIEVKIRHRIKDGLRKRDRFGNRYRKANLEPVKFCDIDCVAQEAFECRDFNLTQVENRDFVENLLQGLTPSSREFIELHYLKGLSIEEIAKMKSASVRNIQRKKNRIIETLKELAKKYE